MSHRGHMASLKLTKTYLQVKGLKALNVLLINLKKYNIKPSIQCRLFDSLVGSILNYTSEVWCIGTIYNIEKVHFSFCKRVLNVKTSTSTLSIYSELGRYPLYANRYCRTIKYQCNIVQSNDIILKCMFYAAMLKQLNDRKNNWLVNVKEILDNHRFSYVFNDPSCVNLKKRSPVV